MFCVIQKLATKKENPQGFPKRLEVIMLHMLKTVQNG